MNEQITWAIIDKYFDDNPSGLVSHQLDSYNQFFNTGIKQIFKEKNPIRIMKQQNPKYVPREWMLVKAYINAESDNYEYIKLLEKVFMKPYDEQKEFEDMFYILQPLVMIENNPGTSSMTCSS